MAKSWEKLGYKSEAAMWRDLEDPDLPFDPALAALVGTMLTGHLCTLSMPWGVIPVYVGDPRERRAIEFVSTCPVCHFGNGRHWTNPKTGEQDCAWLNSARSCGIA